MNTNALRLKCFYCNFVILIIVAIVREFDIINMKILGKQCDYIAVPIVTVA